MSRSFRFLTIGCLALIVVTLFFSLPSVSSFMAATPAVTAQATTPIPSATPHPPDRGRSLGPQTVHILADDGLTLVGDYWNLLAPGSSAKSPAVLLLHEYGASRSHFNLLIKPLLEDGYIVLAVDMRGFGETGGKQDLQAAVHDVQTWLDWLRNQIGVNPNSISIIGASIGADLALIGCGLDPKCETAIALSPVLTDCADCSASISLLGKAAFDFLVTATLNAVKDGLRDRSALLIGGTRDPDIVRTISHHVSLAQGDFAARLYNSNGHGTVLLQDPTGKSVMALIVSWLKEHVRKA